RGAHRFDRLGPRSAGGQPAARRRARGMEPRARASDTQPQDRPGHHALRACSLPRTAYLRRHRIAPDSRALATAAVRELTPSLVKMCTRWLLTVASLRNSARPMSLLVSPAATRVSTSVSRVVSRVVGLATCVIRRIAMSGARALLPAAAARTPATRWCGSASLSRYP